jgi:hypothetical protein
MSTAWNGLATTVVPPGGFHYKQPLKDGRLFIIEAFEGWPELAKNVLRFRLEQISIIDASRANPDAVDEDIRDYVCKNYPGSCLGGWVPAVAAPVAVSDGSSFKTFAPLIQRISEWIGRLGNEGFGFVPIQEADRRAAICAQCRLNIRWEVGCGPCVAELTQNTTRILAARKTRHDEKLKGCRKFGWSNRIACWLDVEKSTDQTLPAHCWNKQ